MPEQDLNIFQYFEIKRLHTAQENVGEGWAEKQEE